MKKFIASGVLSLVLAVGGVGVGHSVTAVGSGDYISKGTVAVCKRMGWKSSVCKSLIRADCLLHQPRLNCW